MQSRIKKNAKLNTGEKGWGQWQKINDRRERHTHTVSGLTLPRTTGLLNPQRRKQKGRGEVSRIRTEKRRAGEDKGNRHISWWKRKGS